MKVFVSEDADGQDPLVKWDEGRASSRVLGQGNTDFALFDVECRQRRVVVWNRVEGLRRSQRIKIRLRFWNNERKLVQADHTW